MKQIVLISDTHYTLDERCFKYLKEADEIWHAGDIGNLSVINKMESFATIRCVWGNIDNNLIRSNFKETLCFRCEKVKVLITHIGGYPGKYNKEILPIIEKERPNLFISGHSHILKVIYDKKYELLHMNPGAIGDYGVHKVKTILVFKIIGNKIQDLNIIEFSRNKS